MTGHAHADLETNFVYKSNQPKSALEIKFDDQMDFQQRNAA